MRKVKCRYCGKQIRIDEAYGVAVGKVNRYYCNAGEEAKDRAGRESERKFFYHVDDIFGSHVTNTVFYNDMKALAQTYAYVELLDYVVQNKQSLYKWMGKDFASEYAKGKYFVAILRNNMGDFVRQNRLLEKSNIKKASDFEQLEVTYKPKERRKPLNEIVG